MFLSMWFMCVCVYMYVCRTPSLITWDERSKKPLIPSSVNSPLLRPNIFLSTLFLANILNLFIYLSMTYEVKFKHHLLQPSLPISKNKLKRTAYDLQMLMLFLCPLRITEVKTARPTHDI